MNWNDTLRYLDTPLPEDIRRLKDAGFYEQAITQIDTLLDEDWTRTQNGGNSPDKAENCIEKTPDCLRYALLAQREIMTRIPQEYPYTQQQALARMQAEIRDVTQDEFLHLVAENKIDWRFVNGEKHYAKRFCETLIATDDTYALRAGVKPNYAARAWLGQEAAMMQEKKKLSAKITLKYSMQASEEAFAAALAHAKAEGRNAVHVKAWLPVPAECPSQSQIHCDSFWQEPTMLSAPDTPQRTVYWETELAENKPIEAVYSYVRTAAYVDPLDWQENTTAPECSWNPQEYLGEELPHIRFTPAMRRLTQTVIGDAQTDAEKASRIYDYITLNVKYRYMPQYFVLEDIAETCAYSRHGDCGVQALTFVTMCRIAGVPALWESGLAVSKTEGSCHDWAMFWLEDKGWLYADCSFGGSAARRGEEALRRHYFGNLDTGRMAANHAFQAKLTPPKESWRADPYDNQTGEMELEGVGLTGEACHTTITTLQYEIQE